MAVTKKAVPKKTKAAAPVKAKAKPKVKTSSAQRKAMAQADIFRKGLLPQPSSSEMRNMNNRAKSKLPHGVRPSGRHPAARRETGPR